MTRDEAKFLLQACGQNQADPSTPEALEALSMAANDPELAKWLENECEFDDLVAEQVQNTSPPEDLRGKLSQINTRIKKSESSKIISFPRRFLSHNIVRTAGSFAAAAAVVIFVAVLIFDPIEATADSEIPKFFNTIHSEMMANATPHLLSTEHEDLLRFLEEKDTPTHAPLPDYVHALQRTGASTVNQGTVDAIGVLHLSDKEGRQFRLFVLEVNVADSVAPPLPETSLREFKQISILTWQSEGKVHALVTEHPASVLEALRQLKQSQ